MDIQSILPKKGVVPPRPATLLHVNCGANNDQIVINLLQSGRTAAYGGLSLVGEEGHPVCVVGLLQAKDGEAKGWTFTIGNPNRPNGFDHIDTTKKPLTELPFPNTIVYFAAEADEKLVAFDAPTEELEAVARFILPFISDDGPPQGIDW